MDPLEKKADISPDIFWYKGKEALLKILLSKIKNLSLTQNKERNVLLIGVGYSSEQSAVIKKYGNLDVIDINHEVIETIDSQLVNHKICCDILEYQTDKKYDLIILLDVIEHIQNENACFKKLKDLVSNDGFIILTVPAYQFLFCNYDRKFGHFRRYNKKMIEKNNYFDIVQIGYWNLILFPAFAIERLYEKFFNKEHTFKKIPVYINKICYKIISFENFLISKGINLPFGLSLYSILTLKKLQK